MISTHDRSQCVKTPIPVQNTPARAAMSLPPEIACAITAPAVAAAISRSPSTIPTTWNEYDAIRWYLAHGRTLIYVEKKQWYLLVMTRCNYLTDDDRCRIYLNRPKVCREYTTDNCEYDGEWTFDKIFETPEQIWEYAEAVLPPAGTDGPSRPLRCRSSHSRSELSICHSLVSRESTIDG